MKWGHFILERSEVKHTVMSWLFSHSSGTTTRLVDGGERVLMFPLLKQSSWCSEKDSSCYVNSGSKDCRHKFKVLIKMWRLVRKYLRLQCLNIKCNGLKCFAVLSSSSVPFVNCVGQLFVGVLTIKSYNKLNKCQSHLFSSSRMKWKSLNQHKHHISVANMNLFEISGHSRNNAACNLLNVKCKVPSCVQNLLTSSRINAATRSHF